MGDAGAAMQRAQDKVAQMQARSGALDELLASGALTDLTNTNDDIQAQLDKASATVRHRRADRRLEGDRNHDPTTRGHERNPRRSAHDRRQLAVATIQD